MMGAERRSAVITPDQQKTTAYHEAGHAIATMYLDGNRDPLHKVTIIPRGRALGVTMSLPVEDRVTYDKGFLENQIAILFGGRIAEELCLNQQTSGASNDIERATDIARRMVTQWGMSSLGPIHYGERDSAVFLGRDIGNKSNISESMAGKVDAEIRVLVDRGYDRCLKVIKSHMKELEALTQALLEHETLDAKQIDDLLVGKAVVGRASAKVKVSDEIKNKKPVKGRKR